MHFSFCLLLSSTSTELRNHVLASESASVAYILFASRSYVAFRFLDFEFDLIITCSMMMPGCYVLTQGSSAASHLEAARDSYPQYHDLHLPRNTIDSTCGFV
jgi:hypothetical protein